MSALRRVLSSVVAAVMGAERDSEAVPRNSQEAFDAFQAGVRGEVQAARKGHRPVKPILKRQTARINAALAAVKRP